MVAAAGVDAYREQIGALLPRGRAWPRERDTTLGATTAAIAQELAEIDMQAVRLLDELLAARTSDLLTDWETDVGLPDACSRLASTLSERSRRGARKARGATDAQSDVIRGNAAAFGVDIVVEEFDEVRAALVQTGFAQTNNRWKFIWWIEIPTSADTRYFTVSSPMDTPFSLTERNTELECRLQAAKPAHTLSGHRLRCARRDIEPRDHHASGA